MEEFDFKKWMEGDYEVTTRGGHRVRIICADANISYYPIVALVTYEEGEKIVNYSEKGRIVYYHDKDKTDIVLVKKKWKPEHRNLYWYIETQGKVNCTNNIENLSKDRIDFGNCFRTKEEAETMAESIKKLLNEK